MMNGSLAEPLNHGRSSPALGALTIAPLDLRSFVFAMAGGTGYFLIAYLCLALSRFDMTLASLWVPNAAAVATLMLVRVRSELAFFGAIAAGSFSANLMAGNPADFPADVKETLAFELLSVADDPIDSRARG